MCDPPSPVDADNDKLCLSDALDYARAVKDELNMHRWCLHNYLALHMPTSISTKDDMDLKKLLIATDRGLATSIDILRLVEASAVESDRVTRAEPPQPPPVRE